MDADMSTTATDAGLDQALARAIRRLIAEALEAREAAAEPVA